MQTSRSLSRLTVPLLPASLRMTLFILLLAAAAPPLDAQQVDPRRLDLSMTYVAEDSLKVNSSQSFWLQGGSVELGANLGHGFGVAAKVTGAHSSSIGGSAIPLSVVTATFGPRYRWHPGHRLSLYAEGLLGEANGLRSLFPATAGSQPDANGLALQAGGGADYQLSRRFAVRILDAAWSRTQLPNSTDNVQNSLRLGAGLVVCFAH